MVQKKIKKNNDEEIIKTNGILDDVELETREVKLIYKSCCGCGCTEVEILREIPIDSKLQDGDRIRELQAGDRQLRVL